LPSKAQKRAGGADLWFVTADGTTDKLRDIEHDPHVNLADYKGGSYEWVSAVFLEVDKPKPMVLFELAKGWLTGERVEAGETQELKSPHR